MRIVIALGGNALLKRGEPLDVETQRSNIQRACVALAPIIHEHQVILTHGNGPQVGLLALQSAAYDSTKPYPLDVLGAESEGMIGYLIAQEMLNAVPGCNIANLMTQTRVDSTDPAFKNPAKFIGPIYSQTVAEQLAGERGWSIKPDGEHYRRVVPSPAPKEIVEIDAIQLLASKGHLVICVGGGGVPVIRNDSTGYKGVEAVVDKDHASSLLAKTVHADRLLLLTDVDAVYRGWNSSQAQAISRASEASLREIKFPAGSMGPKVTAACDFVQKTGNIAHIGALQDAWAILSEQAGTSIQP